MGIEGLFNSFISGLVFGGLYGVMALGLNIIFGVMRIVNIAHGDIVMLGMFATFWLYQLLGIDPFLSVIIVMPLFFVIGMIIMRLLIHPVVKMKVHPKDKPLYALLVTFGLALLMRNIALTAWSADFRAIYKYTDVPFTMLPLSNGRIGTFILAIAIFLITYLFFKKTYLGLAIQGASQDRDAAMLMGIKIDRVFLFSFGLGIALAASSGSLLSIVLAFSPETGFPFTPKSFCMIIIGGMGSAAGSFLGGIVLGLIESLATQFLPAQLTPAISLITLVIMLSVKPAGLMGRISE
ncbi:MAG: branched-chain amino acid ABC transporter permease [Candidatus Freyarchaeota archaeon]